MAIALVAIVAIGVAIPVFLSQRKAVPVTLVLPPTVENMPMLTNAALQQTEATAEAQAFPNDSVFTDRQAAFYGDGAPAFGIFAAKLVHRPTQSEAAGYWTGVTRGGAGQEVTLTKVPPGALGGTTECGMANADIPFVMCLSLDNSAAVYVIVYTSDITQGTLTAQRLREDVEHH